MAYYKKVVIVEAVWWSGENEEEVSKLMGPAFNRSGDGVEMRTTAGRVYAYPGNWIVRNMLGGFSKYDAETFEQTYELLEDTTQKDERLERG